MSLGVAVSALDHQEVYHYECPKSGGARFCFFVDEPCVVVPGENCDCSFKECNPEGRASEESESESESECRCLSTRHVQALRDLYHKYRSDSRKLDGTHCGWVELESEERSDATGERYNSDTFMHKLARALSTSKGWEERVSSLLEVDFKLYLHRNFSDKVKYPSCTRGGDQGMAKCNYASKGFRDPLDVGEFRDGRERAMLSGMKALEANTKSTTMTVASRNDVHRALERIYDLYTTESAMVRNMICTGEDAPVKEVYESLDGSFLRLFFFFDVE